MNKRDLIGIIFVAVSLPLIVAIAALCLCCHCHLKCGEKSQRPLQSCAAEMELPLFDSPPFDPAYIPPHFKQHMNERSRRHTRYRYDFGPQYTPRIPAANARYVSDRRETRGQRISSEMFNRLEITPDMSRSRKAEFEEGRLTSPARFSV
jgi:hypothetical protein